MFGNFMEAVRLKSPLIHCITSYVTANDCANIVIACGASPIMADGIEEAAQITASADGLCLNLGTLNSRTAQAMLISGKKANELSRPVVLDPVGIGASVFRAEAAARLLNELHFTAIRGNLSEIKALYLGGSTKGVDCENSDKITPDTLDEAVALAKAFAKKSGAITVISGATDIVADGEKAYCIGNGSPLMRCVSGTGCQLTAVITTFIAANPLQPAEAAAAAVCTMGLAGEAAYGTLKSGEGNATYRNRIIDAVFNMTAKELDGGAKYEVR